MADKDINDIFDEIVFSEERISNEAFEQGFSKGEREGRLEGYHLGYHRGAEIGAEIGFYKGVVETLKKRETDSLQKAESTITKLSDLLESFPKDNTADVDIQDTLNNIRAQFKKMCALLKISLSLPISSKMSF